MFPKLTLALLSVSVSLSPLSSLSSALPIPTSQEFLLLSQLALLALLTNHFYILVCVTVYFLIWETWKSRCKFIFEGRNLNPIRVLNVATEASLEFRAISPVPAARETKTSTGKMLAGHLPSLGLLRLISMGLGRLVL